MSAYKQMPLLILPEQGTDQTSELRDVMHKVADLYAQHMTADDIGYTCPIGELYVAVARRPLSMWVEVEP